MLALSTRKGNQILQETNGFGSPSVRRMIYLAEMRFALLLIGLLSIFSISNAQEFEPCGTQDYIQYLDEKYPGFKDAMDQSYLHSVQEMKRRQNTLGKSKFIDTTYVIPVVFHVVYKNLSENLPDEYIIDQVNVLNECFNRENADTVNTRDIFKPFAQSARIRFELAKVDPAGNPTNGITRTPTSVSTFNTFNRATQYDYVKETARGGKDGWDSRKYLNIWVCNLDYTTGQLGLLGYAFPPTNAEFWENRHYTSNEKQGVVLHYEIVGTNNPRGLDGSLYTNQKTAVHEVGHFLGLRHTWGDGGCAVDDFIDDTPAAGSLSRGCPDNKNTCFQDTFPDQIENYMDYGSELCANMFTAEQVGVMRQNLSKLRNGLARAEVVYLLPPDVAQAMDYPDATDIEYAEVFGNSSYALLPNPAKSQLSFYSREFNNLNVEFEIRNMLGQLVYNQVLYKSNYGLRIDGLDMANGLYTVTVKFAGIADTHKIQFIQE